MTDHSPPRYEDSDEEHYDALRRTGFFGNQASGCLMMAKDTGHLLFVFRSGEVQEPYTWGTVGGAHKKTELPVDAAKREAYEETGYSGKISMIPLLVYKNNNFQYSNFLAIVDSEFIPSLGWEAIDYVWCDMDTIPKPLHFGAKALLDDAQSINTITHYNTLFSK